jgi:hypothetical protein
MEAFLAPRRCTAAGKVPMNIDHILQTFNTCEVDYLLIGGMNFLLRHEPVLTYDIDF